MHDPGARTDEGWTVYRGLDPDRIRALLQEREKHRESDQKERLHRLEAARAAALEAAQPRVEEFRRRLDKLGVTPPENAGLTEVDYSPAVTIRYRLMVIGETTRDRFYGTETLPGRTLTAVLADDDQVHIHVTGRPRRSPMDRSQTWDTGPCSSEADLARVIDERGDIHWSPPAPAPEPEPAPEPTAAEIARDLLDELAAEPLNRQGPRGIALATAYATLAAAENPAPTHVQD